MRERRPTSAVGGMTRVGGGAATLIRPAATFSRGEKENHAPAPSPRGRGLG